MQPAIYLRKWLEDNANSSNYLFKLQDLRALFPDINDNAFKTLFSRRTEAGDLIRICRGIYAYKKAIPPTGLLLFHVATLLRADELNYISLETALSDAGVISQVPINWITLMSSGRSNIVNCAAYGNIEFVHTKKIATHIMQNLNYDRNCGMWRADVSLAIKDMKDAKRDCDLIDWDVANELI